jgi:branched-chain amino acid transport system ATP-binding protein
MLRIQNLRTSYGQLEVLRGITMHVSAGEIVVLIGANGAGKSTLLNTVSGLLKPRDGAILLKQKDIAGKPANKIIRMGACLVPEGRQLFAPLSVLDNLILGAYHRFRKEKKQVIYDDVNRVFEIFPKLQERKKQIAGSLSGGEQQMLAIGRALMSKPDLLLLDEPSLGLAPLVVKDIFAVIKQLNSVGTTILLVEQNARAALAIANRGYVLETGRIVAQGESKDLLKDRGILRAYLGKNYKEVWE